MNYNGLLNIIHGGGVQLLYPMHCCSGPKNHVSTFEVTRMYCCGWLLYDLGAVWYDFMVWYWYEGQYGLGKDFAVTDGQLAVCHLHLQKLQ